LQIPLSKSILLEVQMAKGDLELIRLTKRYGNALAVDAMTDTRPESHAHSLSHVFPRLGETGTTQELIDLLAKRSSNQ